jgi:predicted transcriptional regulator
MTSKLKQIELNIVSQVLRRNRAELAHVAGIHLNTLSRVICGGKYTFDTLYRIEQALILVPEKEVF